MAAKTVPQTAQMSQKDVERAYKKSTYGSNIPKSEDVKSREGLLLKRKIEEESLQSGATPEEARARAARTGIGSATPRLDKMAYDETQRQEVLAANPDKNLEGFKSYGDKYRSDARAAVRRLTGQAPLARSPEEFTSQLTTSLGYGEKSGLLTPTGTAKAYASAAEAGLSPEEAKTLIESVANLLKSTRDKGNFNRDFLNPSNAPDYSTGAFKPATVTPTVVAPAVAPVVTPKNAAAGFPSVPTTAPETEVEAGLGIANNLTALNKPRVLIQKGLEEATKNISGKVDKATEAVAKAAKDTALSKSRAASAADKMTRGLVTEAEAAPAVAKAAVASTARQAAEANLALKEADILSRILGPAGKITRAMAPFAKFAGPLNKVMEIVDTARMVGDEKFREESIRDMEAFGERGRKAFSKEGTLGEKAGYVGGSLYRGLSTAKPLLTMAAMQTENRRTGERAAESQRNLTNAQKLQELRLTARRAKISDEEFAKLPTKERVAISRQLGLSTKPTPKQ